MTSIKAFADRLTQLIELADRTLKSVEPTSMIGSLNSELFYELRTSSLSFIINLYGEKHPYYKNFNEKVVHTDLYDTEKGKGILKSIKSELDGGWLFTFKGLVSAEIFSDFLEMAGYLLTEGYKDAAAIMIGSVLEEHLRQLCHKNSINIEEIKSGKPIPKKADLLNSELAGVTVYNKLDQKNVTALLDLRNKAAHGKAAMHWRPRFSFVGRV